MQPSLCYGGTLVLLSKSYTTFRKRQPSALFCAAARPRQTQSLVLLWGKAKGGVGAWRYWRVAHRHPNIHWDLQYQLYTVSVRVGNPERGHSRSLT